MREFVLLPFYAISGVLAVAALIIGVAGVLLVLIVVALFATTESVLQRLGLLQTPAVPENLVGLRSWWQDDLDCYLAEEASKRGE